MQIGVKKMNQKHNQKNRLSWKDFDIVCVYFYFETKITWDILYVI